MIKIKFFGEGPRDRGRKGVPDEFGVVPILVKRVLQQKLGFEPHFENPAPDRLPKVHDYQEGRSPKGKRMLAGGNTRRVMLALENSKHEFNGVVIVLDRDKPEYNDRLKDMRKGRDLAIESRDCVPSAIGLAIETIEAWVLGDIKAIRDGLGFSPANPINSPESLCGDEGSGKHAKDKMREIFSQDDNDRSDAERVRDIVNVADPATLKKTCSKGFAPFANEVETNLSVLFI